MEAMQISLSGLDAEWQRLELIAQNLANMNTTRTADGGAYRPVRLVTGPDRSFSAVMADRGRSVEASGVRVLGVEPLQNGLRMVHEPGHPDADADGFVTYPNIDHAAQMTLMLRASRAYEANLTAVSIAQQMYSRALEMGRG